MKRILQSITVLLVVSGILVPVYGDSVRPQTTKAATPKAPPRPRVQRLADTLGARSVVKDVVSPVGLLIPEIVAPLDKPDLWVEDAWIGAGRSYQDRFKRLKGNMAPGDTMYLVYDYSNQGKAVIQQWWKTGYYVDGVLVQSTDNRDMNSGGYGTDVVAVAAPVTPGVHYYECRMDYENSIPESDERNNRMEMSFRVGPPAVASGDVPDLIVSDIRVEGRNIEIWIQNVGGGLAKTLSVQGYMNGSSMGPEIAINSDRLWLGPGDFAHFTQFYWTVGKRFEYVIRAVADPSDSVAESNEDNNEMTVKIIRR
jgi:hypothetical protein